MKKILFVFNFLFFFGTIWLILCLLLKLVSVLNINTLIAFPEHNGNMTVAPKKINSIDLTSKDYSQLVNLPNFKFLNLVQCFENGQYPHLLIGVHTAPRNVEKRKAIRETWGMNKNGTKLVFFMGMPAKDEEINIIAAEQKKFKDIVQV